MGERRKDREPAKRPTPRKEDAPIRERRLPPLPEEERLIEQQVEEGETPVKKKRPGGSS